MIGAFLIFFVCGSRFIQSGDAESKNIAVHRFLVQSKPIDAATYDAIVTLPQQKAAVEVSFVQLVLHAKL